MLGLFVTNPSISFLPWVVTSSDNLEDPSKLFGFLLTWKFCLRVVGLGVVVDISSADLTAVLTTSSVTPNNFLVPFTNGPAPQGNIANPAYRPASRYFPSLNLVAECKKSAVGITVAAASITASFSSPSP